MGTRENTSMAADNSQRKKRWWIKQGRKAKTCTSLRVIHGHLSSQELGVGTKVPKVWRTSRAPRWHCKRRLRFLCRIHRARLICVTDDGCKSNGCHRKATRMSRTSSGRRISLHPGQNWRWPIVIESSKSQNVQIFGYVYQSTNGQNHGQEWKTQSFPLSEICTVILWQDYYGKGHSGKFYWNTAEKSFKLGMVIR